MARLQVFTSLITSFIELGLNIGRIGQPISLPRTARTKIRVIPNIGFA